MKVTLIHQPTEEDWWGVKQRALLTVGLKAVLPPHLGWKMAILRARHSPIRYLVYSFLIEGIPSNTATHLARHHVGIQPYISSLRNDRQDKMDGDAARRDTPVNMIIDVNAEALMVLANKRLCLQAAPKTRQAVAAMCRLVEDTEPEVWKGLLVPACEHQGGVCHEIKPCGRRGTCPNTQQEPTHC